MSLISKLLHRSLALFYPSSSAVEVDKKRRCYSSALMKRAKLWMNHKGIFLLAPLQSITSFERYTAHNNLKVGPHGLFLCKYDTNYLLANPCQTPASKFCTLMKTSKLILRCLIKRPVVSFPFLYTTIQNRKSDSEKYFLVVCVG